LKDFAIRDEVVIWKLNLRRFDEPVEQIASQSTVSRRSICSRFAIVAATSIASRCDASASSTSTGTFSATSAEPKDKNWKLEWSAWV
jgi:hypothetical protein